MSAVAEKKGFVAPKPDTLGQKTDVMAGDIVHWYDGRPEGDNPPIPAVVVRVGVGTSLSLMLFEPNNVKMRSKDGAKHHTDPTINEHDLIHVGTWDYQPRTKQLMRLVAELTPNAAQPPKK